MEIKIFENEKELIKEVAKIYVDLLNEKNNATLGLATGSTPLGIYQELINLYNKNKIDFSNIKTFNLDEYCGLKQDDKNSYYSFMKENLFNHINIKKENINFPSGEKDIEFACKEYQNKLDNNIIDLQLLGIGRNGHIAFNEPNTSFNSHTHCVDLDEKTINDNARFFNSIEEVPKKAITMGLKDIMNAKKIILVAIGDNKKEAIRKMVSGPITEELPASILQNHDNVIVFLDKKAGSLLDV